MARKAVQGEKPLYWVGSSKEDLLAFPSAVKDRLGVALSVAQRRNRGKARGREFSRLLRITPGIPGAPSTQFGSSGRFMCSTRFRRNRPEASKLLNGMWSWYRSV